ncbi:MAG: hypothetical protein QNJ32_04255 [Xenococcaceae cyanobacterium MO_167.B27]|nr:hypothetical protein [Xenococcaceae cyanobacterium MO_167.B27]
MNQYPNCWLTLLLAFILLPPFALKTLSERLEPYPAIILPSGAGKIDVSVREVSFNRTSLWGKHEKNNTWTRISLETFWPPIPRQYFQPIVRNSLSLKLENQKIISPPKEVKERVKEIMNKMLSNKVTSSEVDNTKYWWCQKLVQSGYASDEIMIVSEEVKFDIETGKIITIKRSHEEIFRLD